KGKGGEGRRTQSSSSVPVSPLDSDWPSPPSPPSEGFLMTFFWTTGCGATGLRITRRGIASVPLGAPAWPPPNDAACPPEEPSGPGLPPGRRAWITGADPPPPPPLGGRVVSRIRDPHLWQTVAVTELRVPQVGHGFEPILRISSSSRSQSSKVTKVGCLRHHSWNSRSDSARPSCREASSLNFCTTSSYWRRIFSSYSAISTSSVASSPPHLAHSFPSPR